MTGASTTRRLLVLAAVSIVATLALTLAVLAQEAPAQRAEAEKEAAKLDCRDFATQRGAQAALFDPGEDRLGLDRDGDGVACETGEGSKAAEDGTRLGAETGGDADCMDFVSQRSAQEHLKADPSDPDGLDPERNGVACEIRPAAYEDPATDPAPVDEARSDAAPTCEDLEYQQEAQMIFSRDQGDSTATATASRAKPYRS